MDTEFDPTICSDEELRDLIGGDLRHLAILQKHEFNLKHGTDKEKQWSRAFLLDVCNSSMNSALHIIEALILQAEWNHKKLKEELARREL